MSSVDSNTPNNGRNVGTAIFDSMHPIVSSVNGPPSSTILPIRIFFVEVSDRHSSSWSTNCVLVTGDCNEKSCSRSSRLPAYAVMQVTSPGGSEAKKPSGSDVTSMVLGSNVEEVASVSPACAVACANRSSAVCVACLISTFGSEASIRMMSNVNVAFAGITGGEPCSPYASSGGISTLLRSPSFICASDPCHPSITPLTGNRVGSDRV